MKIPFILVLLSFLTKVACSNGQSRKKSLSTSKQCEKNIDSIDIAKNMKVSNEDIDDSLFLKIIIDGSFFEAKKSEEQDYILAIRHCLSHTDEQYDEAFADGLNHMLQKYPQKIEGLQKAMEMQSHTQCKTANENMITYIVSSWMMEQNPDSIEFGLFYQTFPFLKNNSTIDSVLIEQGKNIKF